MLEAVRDDVALASGLTEASRCKALDTARAGLSQAPGQDGAPAQRQVQQLADELLTTARSNRELLRQLVRGEVQRAAHALGLVREAEFSALSARVERVERALAATPSTAGRRAGSKQSAGKRPAGTTSAKRVPATTSAKRVPATTSAKRAAKKTSAVPDAGPASGA